MKYKKRGFIFLIFGIFIALILGGFVLGKLAVGRRGDRLKNETAQVGGLQNGSTVDDSSSSGVRTNGSTDAHDENSAPTSVLGSATEFRNPVAAATGEILMPILSQTAIDLPEPPFLVSWCEGKDCSHGLSMKLSCDAPLYMDAKTDSKKIAVLKKGDEMDTRILATKILKLGSYLPIEAPKRIIVSRAGKNLWVTFHDHSWDSAEWPADEFEKNPAYEVVYPKTEAWALVKTKSGLSGYLQMGAGLKEDCPFAKTARK